jgi:Anti-sigma-K factor rskA
MPPRDPDERELEAVRAKNGEDDLDVLRRLGEVARSVTEEDARLSDPPPGLWDRIADTVARSPAPPAAAPPEPGPEAPERAHRPAPTGDKAQPPPSAAPVTHAPPAAPTEVPRAQVPAVAPLDEARRRRRAPAWVLAAAAAVVVLVAGAVSLTLAGGNDETVVAAAQLEPLAAAEPATAELVEADGHLQLDLPLSAADLTATEGFYEVWLIDRDVQRLISLGPVRPDATYVVPDDVDYRDFPIVDVSVEPPDGDPTHSGDSILRGTLS